MAFSLSSGGRCNSLWDPLWSESAWQPFQLVHLGPARAVASTKVDWLETDAAHVLKADLPGLKKEEIKVELEGDRTLSISVERNQEEEKKGDTWHAVERSHGKFLRRFKLPENAEANSVSAKVENGVLTVTVPKIQPKAPEKRSIEIA